MFQLTADEHNSLMLQIATSKPGRGGRRKPALAFTEHGAIMAATVLNTPRAVEVSIYVVRAFIQFRTGFSPDTELSRQLTKLERHLGSHDTFIVGILKTIRELRNVPDAPSIDFGDPEE